LEPFNAPVINNSPLGMLFMDVGQAAFERLMSVPNISQESAIGFSHAFAEPTLYQGHFLNTGVSPLYNGNTLDNTGLLNTQLLQIQTQGSQDEANAISGVPAIPSQPRPPQQSTITTLAFTCGHGNCNHAFGRKSDLVRHCKTVHGVNHVKYFCNIPGCPKSQGHGHGYSQDDKLTEHLWKKHASLGYTKSR
jgi:hypothetical protein